MIWKYIFVNFFVIIAIVVCTLSDCNYQYKYSCYNYESSKQNNITMMYSNNDSRCNLNNISNKAKYILILSKNGSHSTGIIKVNVSLPSIDCNYNVALLVNDNINNENECSRYNFNNEFNMELHTLDQSICVSKRDIIDDRDENNRDKCKEDDISLYFQHVYTGCYALRYTIDGYNYAIKSRKYIETNYQRVEIKEPKFHCTYDDRNDITDTSRNLVTFTFAISILSDISSIILKLIPLSYIDENKEDACFKYSREPQYAWEIINGKLRNLDNASPSNKHCNFMMVHVANGTYTEDIECSFALPVSYNDSYCFFISFNDERCVRNSIWNPSSNDKSTIPCTWTSKCTRVIKSTRAIEYNGELHESKMINADTKLLLPIAIGLIFIILIIFCILICINRLYTHNDMQQVYLNANASDLNVIKSVIDVDDIDDNDDNNENIDISLDDRAIVLLYAKGTKSFMEFMSNFREILKHYCSCHIYDWYAACEWDTVARVSPCEWANELFKKNYRTVWIDTTNARCLIANQIKINTLSIINDEQLNVDCVSDFRDIALSGVLNCAKCRIVNGKFQYSKHFIVRLEGCANLNLIDDPFADLSPHARYLIPYHLSQLCSHLSSKRSDNCGDELMTDEIKLRRRLIEIKNDL